MRYGDIKIEMTYMATAFAVNMGSSQALEEKQT